MAALLQIDSVTQGVVSLGELHLAIYATRQLKARNINSREFRLIGVANLDDVFAFPMDITAAYTLKFGKLISGYIIQFRFVMINEHGLASSIYEQTKQVT